MDTSPEQGVLQASGSLRHRETACGCDRFGRRPRERLDISYPFRVDR